MHGIRRLRCSSSVPEDGLPLTPPRKRYSGILKCSRSCTCSLQSILPELHLLPSLDLSFVPSALDHRCIYCINIRCIHSLQIASLITVLMFSTAFVTPFPPDNVLYHYHAAPVPQILLWMLRLVPVPLPTVPSAR